MLGHMKRPLINLTFHGPEDKKLLAIKLLQTIDFKLIDSGDGPAVPADRVLSEFTDNVPGACLKAARERQKFSQKQLCELTGIPQRHISEMENGKRPIGKKNARSFSEALNVGYKVFL